MRKIWRFFGLECWKYGHDKDVDDLGGMLFLGCKRCPWIHGNKIHYDIEYKSVTSD